MLDILKVACGLSFRDPANAYFMNTDYPFEGVSTGLIDGARIAICRFHQEAIEREREDCAHICESYHSGLTQVIAKKIRARSTTPLPKKPKL